MGELLDSFGGKVSGELIKAADWNGLIAAIEGQLDALRSALETRIEAVETRLDAAETRLDGLDARLAPVEDLAATLRARYRRVDLAATRTSFAIGERAEIVARVTDLDGNPIDVADATTRPWVDFVTVWGALKALPGFETRGGAGDQTISVRVNAQGEARVRLRAEHAEAFAEEQENEVEAVLGATVGAARQPISQVLLNAATPTSSGVDEAFAVISREYDRPDALVMQGYLDAYYVRNPAQSFGRFTSVFNHSWRDYRATVLAFVKPDADPTTADGAQAAGSIQVTFRDWIYPWLIVDYLPGHVTRADDYRDLFRGRITADYARSLDGVFDIINDETASKGLISRQRELAAATVAIERVGLAQPPANLDQLIQTVSGGLKVQQSLFYSQAVTPIAGRDVEAVQIIGAAGARAGIEATRLEAAMDSRIDREIAATERRLLDNVRAEQTTFRDDLLRDDGPIKAAQTRIQEFETRTNAFEVQLGQKAGLETINEILRVTQGR